MCNDGNVRAVVMIDMLSNFPQARSIELISLMT